MAEWRGRKNETWWKFLSSFLIFFLILDLIIIFKLQLKLNVTYLRRLRNAFKIISVIMKNCGEGWQKNMSCSPVVTLGRYPELFFTSINY